MANNQNQIFFIKQNEELSKLLKNSKYSDIMIPINIGNMSKDEALNNINKDMIITGMLFVISDNKDHKDIETYKKIVLSECPNIVENFITTALYKASINNFSVADDIFNTLSNLDGDNNKVKDAIKAYQTIKNNFNYLKDAYSLINSEKIDDGIKLIEDNLINENTTWNTYFILGWAYRKKQNFKKALKYFEDALALDEDCADIYNEASICCIELNDLKKAIKYANCALSLKPDEIKYLSNKAIIELKQNNIDNATELFKKIIEIDPNDPIASKFFN